MARIELEGKYQLAMALIGQGDSTKANSLLDEVVEEARLEESNRDLILKAYKSKLHLNISNTPVRYEISAILMDIFADDPQYGEDVLNEIASVHEMIGDLDHQIDATESLLKRFPQSKHNVEWLYTLGLRYHEYKKDPRRAIQYYVDYLNKVGKKHANSKIIGLKLAACYNAINQPVQAKEVIKKYLGIK